MSSKNSKNQVHCNKSSCITAVQGRFTPDFRVDAMRSKSFDKQQLQQRRPINTPNFSKRDPANEDFLDQQTTFGNERKLFIPKLPLDTLLEEDSVSLNLSTICMDAPEVVKNKPANEGNELLELLEGPEEWENESVSSKPKKFSCLDESSIVDPRRKVLVNNKNLQNIQNSRGEYVKNTMPEVILKKQSQKYDKALILLQAHFRNYKDQAEKQIFSLTQDLAEAKATLKSQMQDRDYMVNVFKNKLKDTKSDLEMQFKTHLKALERKLSEKEQYKRETTDERIQQLRKDFERKAGDSARDDRSRSNSKGYIVLVEENRKLREDLTNLWRDTDKITYKFGKNNQ